MKTVWKFKLELTDIQRIQIPACAQILTCQMQGDDMVLYAFLNPVMKPESRTIIIFGTGHEREESDLHPYRYLATLQQNGFVWHVFERT